MIAIGNGIVMIYLSFDGGGPQNMQISYNIFLWKFNVILFLQTKILNKM